MNKDNIVFSPNITEEDRIIISKNNIELPPEMPIEVKESINLAYAILIAYRYKGFKNQEVAADAISYLFWIQDQFNLHLADIKGVLYSAKNKLDKEMESQYLDEP